MSSMHHAHRGYVNHAHQAAGRPILETSAERFARQDRHAAERRARRLDMRRAESRQATDQARAHAAMKQHDRQNGRQKFKRGISAALAEYMI